MSLVGDPAWSQLVCSAPNTDNFEPILIAKDSFVIGRSQSADYSLSGNRLISSTHCTISRHEDGSVWLRDCSTNGTLVNLTKKIHKEEVQLQHGDEIHLIYRRNNPDANLAFLYQDKKCLEEEEAMESTIEKSHSFTEDSEETVSNMVKCSKRSSLVAIDDSRKGVKRKKLDTDSEKESSDPKLNNSGPKELTAECNTSPLTQPKASTSSTIDHPPKSQPNAQIPISASTKSDSTAKDAYEEALICLICQDILYNCISLQPCMHSFCAGCYSDWMDRSQDCPTCRLKVERINKNHIVNNLVDAYIAAHPEKLRDKEELAELDAKNKITKDMFIPTRPTILIDESESEYDDSDTDIDSVDLTTRPRAMRTGSHRYFGSLLPTGGILPPVIHMPQKTVCRQCPEYKEPSNTGGQDAGCNRTDMQGSTDSLKPGTSSGITGEEQAGIISSKSDYVCTPNQTHIICQCCLQPMPNRSHTENIPPTRCVLCFRSYCHAYWGCKGVRCEGCIGILQNMNFNMNALNGLILDNAYESNILRDHLQKKKISLKDLLNECCRSLLAKEFTCAPSVPYQGTPVPVSVDTAVCYQCGLRAFQELAYQYRKNIPREELPDNITNRPDCYWGKNCRTQRGKPHHAIRFNHICEQTRKA